MREGWPQKFLCLVLALAAFTAVVHAASEIDPCLLDGTPHSEHRIDHACPACSSAWLGAAPVPVAAPVADLVRVELPGDAGAIIEAARLTSNPRGPPALLNV